MFDSIVCVMVIGSSCARRYLSGAPIACFKQKFVLGRTNINSGFRKEPIVILGCNTSRRDRALVPQKADRSIRKNCLEGYKILGNSIDYPGIEHQIFPNVEVKEPGKSARLKMIAFYD